jgi:hypothetical protein
MIGERKMNKTTITEKMNIHKDCYKEASEITMEKLPEFLRKLTEDYSHDYGTICHALAAGAIATAWAMNKTPTGGITGFQAGAVMWEFIRNWNYSSNKTGLKIVDYDNMLYPQYNYKFNKTISSDTWKSLQKEAAEQIQKADTDYEKYLSNCVKYEQDLAGFIQRHPDYQDNPKQYEKICYGTSTEWEEQYAKEKAGFEFAPKKPFCILNSESPVYKHWESIVDGIIPFGYSVKED